MKKMHVRRIKVTVKGIIVYTAIISLIGSVLEQILISVSAGAAGSDLIPAETQIIAKRQLTDGNVRCTTCYFFPCNDSFFVMH